MFTTAYTRDRRRVELEHRVDRKDSIRAVVTVEDVYVTDVDGAEVFDRIRIRVDRFVANERVEVVLP